jgi:hypothetical protein
MARDDAGKYVARAAATGGSRTYRGQRPTKWYLSLALICVVGIALVGFSRYQRQNPSSSGEPKVGTHWVAAVSYDICGTTMPVLPNNPNTSAQITTNGDGLIHISPTTAANAGGNATLARFVALYPGLVTTGTAVKFPGKASTAASLKAKTFTNKETCPAHTKFAGQQGQVQIQAWSSFSSTSPALVGNPSELRLAQGQLITVAFIPTGKTVPKPPNSTVVTLQQTLNELITNPSSTTTPATTTPATTTPATTTPATTGATTTTAGGTTTTSTTTGPTPAK